MDNAPLVNPKKNNALMMTIIVGVVLGAAGFGGGMMFQKSQDSLKGLSADKLQAKLASLGMGGGAGFGAGTRDVNGARAIVGFPGGGNTRIRGGGGFVNGEIISADATSITVKDATGSTKVVYFTSSTAITKSVTGTSTDLTIGQNVTTNGTSNSDGSVAATTIQLRPAGETLDMPPGGAQPIPAQ